MSSRPSTHNGPAGSDREADRLLEEANCQPFEGWDFSYLRGRLTSQPLPWDYSASVAARASGSPDLLDLGTGGGEWLSSLPFRPSRTVATEAWPPNVEVARRRLEPLGVEVVQVECARDNSDRPLDQPSARLPFADGSFHLVVSRHESFEPVEVARILSADGWFITQQVDAGNDDDYRRLLGLDVPSIDPNTKGERWLPGQLEEAGLRVIDHASASLVQHIHDVGALAWNLKAIPWMVPGFSIERYRDRLRRIHADISRNGPIEVRQQRFWIRATKPDALAAEDVSAHELTASMPPEVRAIWPAFRWNVVDLWALDKDIVEIPVAQLTWLLELPLWRWQGRRFVLRPSDVLAQPDKYREHLDKARAADLTFPVHIALVGERWTILDGYHRLLKAVMQGTATIKAVVVTAEDASK